MPRVSETLQEGVTGVLTASTTDVLSHVAIRARSQQVLLATCFDATELNSFKGRQGEEVSLSISANGSVAIVSASEEVRPRLSQIPSGLGQGSCSSLAEAMNASL